MKDILTETFNKHMGLLKLKLNEAALETNPEMGEPTAAEPTEVEPTVDTAPETEANEVTITLPIEVAKQLLSILSSAVESAEGEEAEEEAPEAEDAK